MKKIILLAFITCMSVQFSMAQDTQSHFEVLHQDGKARETKKEKKTAQNKVDREKYWTGKVPMENNIVTFEKTFEAKGKTKAQIYEMMHQFAQNLVENAAYEDMSYLATEDADNGVIMGSVGEDMYFKRSKWENDYTKFYYQLTIECKDGACKVKINNLQYRYEEQHEIKGEYLKAEEWITDDKAFNKKKTDFLRETGKFRRCTIDRAEAILSLAKSALE